MLSILGIHVEITGEHVLCSKENTWTKSNFLANMRSITENCVSPAIVSALSEAEDELLTNYTPCRPYWLRAAASCSTDAPLLANSTWNNDFKPAFRVSEENQILYPIHIEGRDKLRSNKIK